MTLLLALACAQNEPMLVAHRALGVEAGADENQPVNVLEAFEQGFGAEIDIRLDGPGCDGDPSRAAAEGCFDLGHTEPNGYTLADVMDALTALEDAPERPLVIDVVNDPDHAVTTQIVRYLADGPQVPVPVLLQTSSAEGLAILDVARDDVILPVDLQLGLTYFANPEFTPSEGADLYVVHIAELPVLALPLPVAVFGVATEHSMALAETAASDVRWVITDVPGRFGR